MIDGNDESGYSLVCDYCEDEVEEDFEEFLDVVNYKRENGWKSIKGKSGEWSEICPTCADDPDIVRKMKNK